MTNLNAMSANAPAWFIAAQKEIGFRETGENRGIERYIALGKCGK